MFDLHTHSDFSDGVLPPEKLIEEAKEKGLSLLAVTDHDTADGMPRALRAAEELAQPFLTGIEIEAAFDDELHILGLGVDPYSQKLQRLTSLQSERRAERNSRMLSLLAADGMDVYHLQDPLKGTATKADIAASLVSAGYCGSVNEAFSRFLVRGAPYYVSMEHPSVRETMEAITGSGGVAVLAHPMKMRCDHRELIIELKDLGLWGIEAYYSRASEEETAYFRALAREFGLRPTCGSDYHGPGRRDVSMGGGWRDVTELRMTEGILKNIFGITRTSPCGHARTAMNGRTARVSAVEFQLLAERITAELPDDFFIGLNGGVVISDGEKLHRKSRPERPLYILGEYHHGGPEGRYIVLYYGSFMRAHGRLRGERFAEELRRVILHEFRHHLESRAGQHDLEYEDEDQLDEYELSVDVAEGKSGPGDMR
ncbi:MAG: PHP domain-containing protein [Clostridia bacterium]|nr:PHP domain-containing protein [Clostridia bacterium]